MLLPQSLLAQEWNWSLLRKWQLFFSHVSQSLRCQTYSFWTYIINLIISLHLHCYHLLLDCFITSKPRLPLLLLSYKQFSRQHPEQCYFHLWLIISAPCSKVSWSHLRESKIRTETPRALVNKVPQLPVWPHFLLLPLVYSTLAKSALLLLLKDVHFTSGPLYLLPFAWNTLTTDNHVAYLLTWLFSNQTFPLKRVFCCLPPFNIAHCCSLIFLFSLHSILKYFLSPSNIVLYVYLLVIWLSQGMWASWGKFAFILDMLSLSPGMFPDM